MVLVVHCVADGLAGVVHSDGEARTALALNSGVVHCGGIHYFHDHDDNDMPENNKMAHGTPVVLEECIVLVEAEA